MKVELDEELCDAHGECVVAAPEVFDIEEDEDVARVLDAEPDEALRGKVDLAAQLCPVAAIKIES